MGRLLIFSHSGKSFGSRKASNNQKPTTNGSPYSLLLIARSSEPANGIISDSAPEPSQ